MDRIEGWINSLDVRSFAQGFLGGFLVFLLMTGLIFFGYILARTPGTPSSSSDSEMARAAEQFQQSTQDENSTESSDSSPPFEMINQSSDSNLSSRDSSESNEQAPSRHSKKPSNQKTDTDGSSDRIQTMFASCERQKELEKEKEQGKRPTATARMRNNNPYGEVEESRTAQDILQGKSPSEAGRLSSRNEKDQSNTSSPSSSSDSTKNSSPTTSNRSNQSNPSSGSSMDRPSVQSSSESSRRSQSTPSNTGGNRSTQNQSSTTSPTSNNSSTLSNNDPTQPHVNQLMKMTIDTSILPFNPDQPYPSDTDFYSVDSINQHAAYLDVLPDNKRGEYLKRQSLNDLYEITQELRGVTIHEPRTDQSPTVSIFYDPLCKYCRKLWRNKKGLFERMNNEFGVGIRWIPVASKKIAFVAGSTHLEQGVRSLDYFYENGDLQSRPQSAMSPKAVGLNSQVFMALGEKGSNAGWATPRMVFKEEGSVHVLDGYIKDDSAFREIVKRISS